MNHRQTETAISRNPWDGVVHFYYGLAALIFISGAAPVIQGAGKAWVDQKPWIHRLAMLAVTLPALGLWIARRELRHDVARNVPQMTSKQGVLAIWILFLWLAGLWTVSACTRHAIFHSGFDMAIFVQAVWNVFHGPFLYSSIKGGICLLGDHFSPLLALFAVPYAFWSDPRCLLLLQAVSAASGVFFIRRLALNRLASEAWAFLFAVSYALYLPVINSVRFEFHPEVAAMPFWFIAMLALMKNKTGWASFFLALGLSSKENAALVVFGVGLYALLAWRRYRFGLFWMVFAVVYLEGVTRWVIPSISGQDYFYMSGNYQAWAHLGAAAFLRHLISLASVSYLIKIFAPVCFFSFLNPAAAVLVFPALIQNLTSRNESVSSIFYQYTAFLTPFVFMAAIEGAFKLRARRSCFYAFLTAVVLMAGVSEVYVLKTNLDQRTAHVQAIAAFLKKVPPDVSVRTHEFFAPHLAHRRELFIYENQHPREGGSEKAMNAEVVILDTLLLKEKAAGDVASLLRRGYRVVAEEGTLKMFRKEAGVT